MMIGVIFLPFLFWIKLLGRIFEGGKKYLKKNPKEGEKGPFAPLQKEKNDTDDDALWSWCTPDDDDDDVVVVEEAEEDARGRGEEFFFTRDNRKRTIQTTTTKTRGLL